MSNDRQARVVSLASGSPHPAGAQPAQVFRREGDYWTVVYAGATVRLRDAVGMHYLAHLLAHPDQRIAVGDLLTAVKGGTAGDAERARSAVGKRIKAALAHISEQHPALGFHLSSGVKTGYVCVYHPDPSRPARWVV